MKYIKTYEIVNKGFEINRDDLKDGDYVILEMWNHPNHELVNFINNSVGKIIDMTSLKISITVEYENVPDKIKNHFSERKRGKFLRPFHFNEIKYHSKSKKQIAHINKALIK